MKRTIAWAAVALLAGGLAGCGSSTGRSVVSLQVGQEDLLGTFSVTLTGVVDPAESIPAGHPAQIGEHYVEALFSMFNGSTKAGGEVPTDEWVTIKGTDGRSYRWTPARLRGCPELGGNVVLNPRTGMDSCVDFTIPDGTHVAEVLFRPDPGNYVLEWSGPFVSSTARVLPAGFHVRWIAMGNWKYNVFVTWSRSLASAGKHVNSYLCSVGESLVGVSGTNQGVTAHSCLILGLDRGVASRVVIQAEDGRGVVLNLVPPA
jgi:hypothetical protein